MASHPSSSVLLIYVSLTLIASMPITRLKSPANPSTKISFIDQVPLGSNPFIINVTSVSSQQSNVSMGLSLSTSWNYLSVDCDTTLVSFICESEYGCTNTQVSTGTYYTPFIEVIGTWGNQELSILQDWRSYDVILASQCDGPMSSLPIMGVIGMGINGSAVKNFQLNISQFSIYLQPNGLSGELYFGVEQNMISSNPVSISTSTNWTFEINQTVIGDTVISNETLIGLLDLSFDYIGVPNDLLSTIVSALRPYNCVCSEQSDQTYLCNFDGSPAAMPTFNLQINETVFAIPGNVYLNSTGADDVYMLAIIGLGPENVTSAFSNSVILGVPVLSYYYTVFNLNGPSVTLYGSVTTRGHMTIIIVICVLIIILIGGIVFYRIKKARDANPRFIPNMRADNRLVSMQEYQSMA